MYLRQPKIRACQNIYILNEACWFQIYACIS